MWLVSDLDARVPAGSHWLNGILFGIGAWILMMVLVMPMAGAGLFAMALHNGAHGNARLAQDGMKIGIFH